MSRYKDTVVPDILDNVLKYMKDVEHIQPDVFSKIATLYINDR